MTEELVVLKLVCQNLERANISYMLTGSLAANFYAVPRMTRNIDLVIEILEPDVDKFFRVFEKDFYIDRRAIDEAIKYQVMFNIIHQTTIIKIDFILLKNSSYRHLEFQRKRKVLLDDAPIWIVSPEDLIISKLFWAKDSLSEMQIKDVKNLLQTLKNLDIAYMRKWVQMLNLDAVYAKVEN